MKSENYLKRTYVKRAENVLYSNELTVNIEPRLKELKAIEQKLIRELASFDNNNKLLAR